MFSEKQDDILDHDPKKIPPCLAVPAWSEGTSPTIRCTIPDVGQKDSQSCPERKSLTLEYFQTHYPRVLDSCVHRRLCWECSSEWRGGNLHPIPRRQRRQNKPCYRVSAHIPQTAKLKQKLWKQQQYTLNSALMLLTVLSSLLMPCPTTTTCLLPLSPSAETMQSPYSGSCHPVSLLKTGAE